MMQKLLLLFIFFNTAVLALCQQDAANSNLKKQFDTYRSSHYQEKIYVHTDKQFYLAGEISWFKIYLTDAYVHEYAAVSTVAYVEIIDSTLKPVLQAKIELDSGKGSGSLYLPTTLTTGVYQLRAYTAWMKNYPENLFFSKYITVVNAQQPRVIDSAENHITSYHADFFPEGGQLVNNLASRIGVRIAKQYGSGIMAKGEVQDPSGNVVTSFTTNEHGIGSFMFTPNTTGKYKAIIVLADTTINVPLPASASSGYTMLVHEEANKSLRVNIACTADVAASGADLMLLVHTRQTNVMVVKARLQNGKSSITIPADKILEGVATITLFYANGNPLCERLYFKKPTSSLLKLNVSADKASYAQRSAIQLDIASLNALQQSDAANLSLSVYRLDSLQHIDHTSINAWFWLESDLGASIPFAGKYLLDESAEAGKNLDDLMLVYGWRRFKVQNIASNTEPAFQFAPEPDGHVVTGKIIDTRTGKPAPGIESYLSVMSDKAWFNTTKSDEAGNIRFRLKHVYSKPSVVLQTNPADTMYRMELDNPFSNKYVPFTYGDAFLPLTNSNTLLERSIAAQTQSVYHPLRMRQFLPSSDTSTFYQYAEYRYVLDDYTRFTSLEEVFREYIPMVIVRMRDGGYHLRTVERIINTVAIRDPLVILDGVPVFDHDRLLSYDPLKIRKVDVINIPYVKGTKLMTGLVSLSTYDGNYGNFELDPHAVIVDYEALQLQREFYAPTYETAEQKASHLPDFRNQLQWIPNIATGASGKQTVRFYSSDLPGKYVAVVQGISSNGKTGEQMVTFEVE